jgi:prophage regulatory protein
MVEDVSRTKSGNLVRLNGLREILPYQKSKLYELMQAGKLPKPIKLGRASFWDADEVRAAVGKLMQESQASL